MPRNEIRLATSMPRGTQPTPSRTSASRAGRLRNFALGGLLAASLTMAALASSAQAASSVPLGTASNFTVLAATTVTSTGPTVITSGDVGVSPGTAVTGFPPARVCSSCEIHRGDAVASKAQDDLRIAYKNAAGQSTTESPVGGDLTGRTLPPGVYSSNTSLSLNGTLTLDARGDPNAVFVFQAGSSLLVGVTARSKVELIGGADPSNVFWQVGSSATIDPGSQFQGNILALTSITIKKGASLNGRALALNGAITLDSFKGEGCKDACAAFIGPAPGPSRLPRALRYVALGDSYSSGEGLGEFPSGFPPYLPGGDPGCHRHRLAYPSLFTWQGRRTALGFFACSGARTEHIYGKAQQRFPYVSPPQAARPKLNSGTDLVTMTIGGNDVGEPDDEGNGGLSKPLSFCYKNKNCDKNSKFVAEMESNLASLSSSSGPAPSKLYRTLTAVNAKTGQSPGQSRNTTIAVLGYPRVFPTDTNRKQLEEEQKCAAFYRFGTVPSLPFPKTFAYGWDPGEQAFLNRATDTLNGLIAREAAARGVYFFNPTKFFTGHANCDRNGEPWTNGLTDISTPAPLPPPPDLDDYGPGSFHPNVAGQRAYRNFLAGSLRVQARFARRLTPVGLPANPSPRLPQLELRVKTVRLGEVSTFRGRVIDPGGLGIVSARLYFGDGTNQRVRLFRNRIFTVRHRYPRAGRFTASLLVVLGGTDLVRTAEVGAKVVRGKR